MLLPDTLAEVRFTRPVRCGPTSTPAESTWKASESVRLTVERGCVVIWRKVRVGEEERLFIRGVPLSGGGVADVDYGDHDPETFSPRLPEVEQLPPAPSEPKPATPQEAAPQSRAPVAARKKAPRAKKDGVAQ